MDATRLFQNVMFYATTPGAAGLFCVIVFMLEERRRGQLMLLSLSAAVSTNLLLKNLFRVSRPWLMHVENAPYLAEGGYALPCEHTQLTAALLCAFALTSGKKSVRFLCALGIWLTAVVRILTGLQSILDVLVGGVVGMLIAFVLCRFWYNAQGKAAVMTWLAVIAFGFAAAILSQDGWGFGSALSAMLLSLPEKGFRKAEDSRTTFGKIYGTVFAAGIYVGLIIFLPFLVEWLITPLWPGQTLIVLLITLLPCLLRLCPLF